MNNRNIEKISTYGGVILLAMLAVFGILGCFELVFDVSYFYTTRAAEVWTVIPLITCVLIFCCFLVSTMLNISRIAESLENIGKKVSEETSTDRKISSIKAFHHYLYIFSPAEKISANLLRSDAGARISQSAPMPMK